MTSQRKHILLSLLLVAGIVLAIVLHRAGLFDRRAAKEPTASVTAPAPGVIPDAPGDIGGPVAPGPGNAKPVEETRPSHPILWDREASEAERNNAANGLRRSGDTELVPALRKMLWDETESPKWRNYCVQHLYQAYEDEPDPAVLDTIFQAAEAEEKMVRICAVWSLARLATPRYASRKPDAAILEKVRSVALAALRDGDAHYLVTEAGVQSCARLGLTEALPEIRALAGSDATRPEHLRVIAVASLGELGDEESAPLLEKLSVEATGQLQAAARLALKRVKEAGEAGEPGLAPEDRF